MTTTQWRQAWAIAVLFLAGWLSLGLAIVYDRTQQAIQESR